jgi:hypothetical protein
VVFPALTGPLKPNKGLSAAFAAAKLTTCLGDSNASTDQDRCILYFRCCRRRQSFLSGPAKQTFELALERVRRTYLLRVFGYVVMPEHVHLLMSEPQRGMRADAIKSLKQGARGV